MLTIKLTPLTSKLNSRYGIEPDLIPGLSRGHSGTKTVLQLIMM